MKLGAFGLRGASRAALLLCFSLALLGRVTRVDLITEPGESSSPLSTSFSSMLLVGCSMGMGPTMDSQL